MRHFLFLFVGSICLPLMLWSQKPTTQFNVFGHLEYSLDYTDHADSYFSIGEHDFFLSSKLTNRISLRDNISVVLNIFHYELKRDISLDYQVAPDHDIMGYEVKLFQLWSNLIKNAIDAMEEETEKTLIIRSAKTDSGISVTVENTGPEIPASLIGQIFRKFFTTKHQKSGTGLGLSIVKNVADEHGATVSVRSENRRTAFTVTFPPIEG